MTRSGSNNVLRDFPRRLIEHEESLGHVIGERCTLIDQIVPSLVPLVGKAGFCSLLSRALTLARRECPELGEVQITESCTLTGLSDTAPEAVRILLTQLIGLLDTFLGETLTLRLLRHAWPELAVLEQKNLEQNNHE